jgi:hypothetical protein
VRTFLPFAADARTWLALPRRTLSWAESVNALRLQTGQAPSMEAYFRMAHNSGYHLLRHMTASTPSL